MLLISYQGWLVFDRSEFVCCLCGWPPKAPRRNKLHNFAVHSRRAAALRTACSARTAARRMPCIVSGYGRQMAQLIPARGLRIKRTVLSDMHGDLSNKHVRRHRANLHHAWVLSKADELYGQIKNRERRTVLAVRSTAASVEENFQIGNK